MFNSFHLIKNHYRPCIWQYRENRVRRDRHLDRWFRRGCLSECRSPSKHWTRSSAGNIRCNCDPLSMSPLPLRKLLPPLTLLWPLFYFYQPLNIQFKMSFSEIVQVQDSELLITKCHVGSEVNNKFRSHSI